MWKNKIRLCVDGIFFFLIKDNVTDIEQRVVQGSGRGVQENGESAMSRTDRQIDMMTVEINVYCNNRRVRRKQGRN